MSGVRSGYQFSASLRACEIACNAPHSSTIIDFFALDQSIRINELQSVPPKHGQILTTTDIQVRDFFSNAFRGCGGIAATGGTRRTHHFTHVEEL